MVLVNMNVKTIRHLLIINFMRNQSKLLAFGYIQISWPLNEYTLHSKYLLSFSIFVIQYNISITHLWIFFVFGKESISTYQSVSKKYSRSNWLFLFYWRFYFSLTLLATFHYIYLSWFIIHDYDLLEYIIFVYFSYKNKLRTFWWYL